MNVNDREWLDFVVNDVFTISPGKRFEARNRTSGSRPFIGALDNNNGVAGFVSDVNESVDSNVLGVNYNGNGVCLAFYHPYECIFSDDVKRFHLKSGNDCAGRLLFLKVPIQQQKDKFCYLYKFNAERMMRQRIMLPTTSGTPDFAYMDEYASSMEECLLARYRGFIEERLNALEFRKIPDLAEKKWEKFKAFGADGMFRISATKSSIDGIRLIDGDDKVVPYVTRSDQNNGVVRFVSRNNMSYGYDEAARITVGLDTQTAFWQPHSFVTGQNIHVITGDSLNEYVAQFLILLFRLQMKAKFNWGGNGATLGRMKTLNIMLPVNDSGKPDFEYMEQYIKNLMFRKYRQYLSFLDARE